MRKDFYCSDRQFFYWPGYIILGPLEKHTGNLEMPVFDAYIFYQLEVLLPLDCPIVNKVASYFYSFGSGTLLTTANGGFVGILVVGICENWPERFKNVRVTPWARELLCWVLDGG